VPVKYACDYHEVGSVNSVGDPGGQRTLSEPRILATGK